MMCRGGSLRVFFEVEVVGQFSYVALFCFLVASGNFLTVLCCFIGWCAID